MRADVRCSRCGKRKANYYRPSSGERLCIQCLIRSVEDRALDTIRRRGLVGQDDVVGICVSGGKDSLSLIKIIGSLRRRARFLREAKMMALTIDEGFEYSKYKLSARADVIRSLCDEYGIQHHVIRVSDVLGFTISEVAERLSARGVKLNMCTVCGVLKRKVINIVARRLGLTKIMTAHNLDDEAQTVILNVISNDIKRFVWFGEHLEHELESYVPRVKPLKYVREEELALYAYYNNLPLFELECPYVRQNPRYMLKFILAELERRNPNVKYMIVAFGENLSRALRSVVKTERLSRCRYCGDPASSSVCRACELVDKAGLLESYLKSIRS